MILHINQHLPALQVLLPLSGALLSVISFGKKSAQIITIIISIATFTISLYSLFDNDTNVYRFGNWHHSIGIEYKLDFFNKCLTFFLNISLMLLIFCQKLINETVIAYINDKRQNLFYAILLFAHAGYTGILSTNDIFNLYVFIEISSLSAYVLIAQGSNSKAVQGAFDYLIIGSVGATLILIGIGFLLSCVGTLNIDELKLGVGADNSRIIFTAGCFIIIGTTLKMALFPMHFWMRKVYSAAPSVILMYISSVSSVVGYCILSKFFNLCADYPAIKIQLSSVVIPITLIAILLCAVITLSELDSRCIIIYSAAINIGYVILLALIFNDQQILLKFLFTDGINKISLFFIIARIENQNFKSNSFWTIFVVLTMICSAGLPLSSMFMLKINILEFFITRNMYLALVTVVISSAIGILYHYKIAHNVLMNNSTITIDKQVCYDKPEMILMTLLISFQILFPLFHSW